MKVFRASLRQAALAAWLSLFMSAGAQARTYLVCYLPPDTEKRLIHFCPGGEDAVAGDSCQCQSRTETFSGWMTPLSIPDTNARSAGEKVCAPRTATTTAVTLCAGFRSTGETSCTCNGSSGNAPGETYSVSLMPRVPLRTNQAAAADFLKRLQECCVTK